MKKIFIAILFCYTIPLFAKAVPPAPSLTEEVQNILTHYHLNAEPKKIKESAIKGMIQSLDDPYTKYIPKKEFEKMSKILKEKTAQIGIDIGIRDHHYIILSVQPQSPAEKYGLKPLDQILEIDQTPIAGKSLFEIETLLLGDKGSRITLAIRRLTTSKTIYVTLNRDNVPIKAIDKKEIFYDKVGYIKISSFYHPQLDKEFEQTLNLFLDQNIESLIIDLRSNGGGLLKQSLAIASFFIEEGKPILFIQRKEMSEQTLFARGNSIGKNLPLIVLVNEGTASSSEILAAAIRDHEKGILVGTPTFGKTSVQQVFPLQNGSAIVCSIAKYKTAKGQDISQLGLQPDLIENIPQHIQYQQKSPYYRYDYQSDNQLMAAITVALQH